MMRNLLSLLILSILISSCSNTKKSDSDSTAIVSQNYTVRYAKGFQVVKTEDYTHLTVTNPWDTTQLLHSYVLVAKEKELPNALPKGTIIRTPISRSVATSAIHCSMLHELNSLDILIGQCEPHFVNIDYVKENVANGKIVDLGMASAPNTEAIIMLNPEVVFSDPVTGQSQANIEKTKIPIIQTADYTEPHPLGRAEWIRFYSHFIGNETYADSLFDVTAQRYNDIKETISAIKKRPTVFTDTRYQGSWNMPGGRSYMASLLEDAGGKYLWSDNESNTFMPLSFEAVLDKAGNGDIWLIRYYADRDITYKGLEQEYKPYTYFKAYKEQNIFGCNTTYTKYFIDLPIHPDYILKDLANVFHPNLFPNYKSRYYSRIK